MMSPGRAAAGRLQDRASGRLAGAPAWLRGGVTLVRRVILRTVKASPALLLHRGSCWRTGCGPSG
jgi:hypothetical protein